MGMSVQPEPHPIQAEVNFVKMIATVAALFLVLLPSWATGQPEIILSADSNSTVAGKTFTFNCSTNSTIDITLYIDDATNSPKADRVNTTNPGGNVTQYTFFDIVPEDNGTVFVCQVENFASNDLELVVYYPPIFAAGNNSDIWVEHSEDTNFTLSCTVVSANPPDYNMSYSNTSSFTDNVAIGDEELVFKNGTISNRGNYSCYADNGIHKTMLNYRLFVGGDPNVTINTSIVTTATELNMSITVMDNGDAPATGVVIHIPDVLNDNVTVDILKPIVYASRTYENVVEEVVDAFGPGEYNVSMDVFNQLGTVTNVFETTFSITSSSAHTSTTEIIISSSNAASPTPVPKKNNNGAIVAGVLVPILVLIIAVIAIIAGIIVYKKLLRRRRKGYSLYHHENTDSDNRDYESFKTT